MHPEHEFLHFEQAGARGVPASRSLFEVTCCKLGLPQSKAQGGSCVIANAGHAARTLVRSTARAAPTQPPTAGAGALCIGMQSLRTEKPQAARLRTGRSCVAAAHSGSQTLPKLLQQQRTLNFAPESQTAAAEQLAACGDLTLFGVRGGTQQVGDSGEARQPRRAWSRLDAARTWAARDKGAR